MTIHEATFMPYRQSMMTVCLLLLALQLALLLAAARAGTGKKIRFLYLLHFLFGVAFLYLPMLDIAWDINYPNGAKPLPDMLSAFVLRPVSLMLLYETISALIVVVSCFGLFRYRKDHLNSGSIKETMDLLPAGIAYEKRDGTAVFSNLTMNRLSRAVTGKGIIDLSELRKAAVVKTEDQSTFIIEFTGKGGVSTWQFSNDDLEVDGEEYSQFTAIDISEQAAVTRELEEKNKKLRELHMRLDIYNRQADRIIIAQELLTARMAVHNEVGNVLLESRHYLKDPASFDEEMLLRALKNTNMYLLKEYEEDDTGKDPLAEALEMAEAIGVDVVITGVIPPEDAERAILAAAVSECASNTVKHADGDTLSVGIRDTGSGIEMILQNNGEKPGSAIRESGGLLTLRSLVEKENGSMDTAATPAFTLTIRLPKTH